MEPLIVSLQNLVIAGWDVVIKLGIVVVPWFPMLAWIAFWLLAVNWEKLYPILARGGYVVVLLLGLVTVLVWGLMAPPPDGVHYLFGLKPSNFVGKTAYVTMLLTIMALCGSVQLSGAFGSVVRFPFDEPVENHRELANGHEKHDDRERDDYTG